MVSALDSRPFRFQVTTLDKLFTRTYVHLSAISSIIWYRSKDSDTQRTVIRYGWEGNRRSGIALSMRHRHKRFIHLRMKGDEHAAYTPLSRRAKAHLPIPYL